MQAIALWQLRLIILAIRLHVGLDVAEWLMNFVLDPVHEGEVAALLAAGEERADSRPILELALGCLSKFRQHFLDINN